MSGLALQRNARQGINKVIYIGVDPGLSGGIGVIREEFSLHGTNNIGTKAEAFKMPATEMDLYELLKKFASWGHLAFKNPIFCYLEKAQAFPGGIKFVKCPRCSAMLKTKQAQGVVSTGKFLQQYGTIRGILTALHIPFETITANTWQKALGCQTRGDKNISKAKAQQLFPDIKVTHAKADALLIAEFCRRMRNQGVSFSKTTIPLTQDGSESTIKG